MFADLENPVPLSDEDFDAHEASIRPRLIAAQRALREAGIPVVIVVGGVEGAGKGEVVHRLVEWMDPRYLDVHALEPPTDEEQRRAQDYRYWRRLPAAGRVGIFLGSWYTDPIVARVYKRQKRKAFAARLDRLRRLEEMWVRDGTLVIKLWLHVSKQTQGDRLRRLERKKATRFRVTPQDWDFHARYDRFVKVSQQALAETSTDEAPWTLIAGGEDNARDAAVTDTVLDALEERAGERPTRRPARPRTRKTVPRTVLDSIDLTAQLDPADYKRALAELRLDLNRLARKLYRSDKGLVLAFEGCDAAGKGGAIRRVVQAMHPKVFRVVPVGAPDAVERQYPYLWRFWRQLRTRGKITVFDRSWYGRVLVERVEGFCSKADWQRAYQEIVDFEDDLVRGGYAVRKFWLQISQDEQLRRFEAREQTPHKRHKITEEDWRNRERWPLYAQAVDEMVSRTHRPSAPWFLISSEDKRWARIQVMKAVRAALRELVD